MDMIMFKLSQKKPKKSIHLKTEFTGLTINPISHNGTLILTI